MILGVIQCRTGSKRLHNKALLPLAGKPMIWRYIERVKRVKMLDEIVLATTWKDEDKVLCDIAGELGIKFFCGSENDLVDRIYKCAIKYNADVIVRLTADNPLIEPEEIDKIITYFLWDKKAIMYSNTHNIQDNGYPNGLGAEVYNMGCFGYFYEIFSNKDYREHPHKSYYSYGWVETCPCSSDKRYPDASFTVDTQEEYEKVNAIYDKYGAEPHFNDYCKEL